MGNKSSINRAEKLKEWSVNALKERHIQKILFHGKRMLKVFQIWFFRLKMTSKSNGQSRKEAGYKEPPVYMEDFYLGLSFDRSMFLITFQKKHMLKMITTLMVMFTITILLKSFKCRTYSKE
jgi:hypothetical protein